MRLCLDNFLNFSVYIFKYFCTILVFLSWFPSHASTKFILPVHVRIWSTVLIPVLGHHELSLELTIWSCWNDVTQSRPSQLDTIRLSQYLDIIYSLWLCRSLIWYWVVDVLCNSWPLKSSHLFISSLTRHPFTILLPFLSHTTTANRSMGNNTIYGPPIWAIIPFTASYVIIIFEGLCDSLLLLLILLRKLLSPVTCYLGVYYWSFDWSISLLMSAVKGLLSRYHPLGFWWGWCDCKEWLSD